MVDRIHRRKLRQAGFGANDANEYRLGTEQRRIVDSIDVDARTTTRLEFGAHQNELGLMGWISKKNSRCG